jgi:hypothetical protein
MTENRDENLKIIATLNCPFCNAIIIEEVEIGPEELDDSQDEIKTSDDTRQYSLPYCNHVAFLGVRRGNAEIISEKWQNEMMILAKDLGAEFIETESAPFSKWRHNSPVSTIANILYSNNYIKKGDNYEKIQDILNRLFPNYDSSVINAQMNKNHYAMIFIKKSEIE